MIIKRWTRVVVSMAAAAVLAGCKHEPPPQQRAQGDLQYAKQIFLRRTDELVEHLSAPDPTVRHQAVKIVQGPGPDASRAVPVLTEAIDKESNPHVRRAMRRGLTAISGTK